MTLWKNIVVGLDFSENSQRALRVAFRVAEPDHAAVHALHVVESLAITELQHLLQVPLDQVQSEVETDMKQRLESMFKETKPGGYDILEEDGSVSSSTGTASLEVSAEVRFGNPTEEMLNLIDELNAELLVLARNSTSKPDRGPGTYAMRCVRKAQTNILLTHGNEPRPYRHIVACVDFSEHAERGLELAVELARRDGARLELLHAFYPPWEVVHYTSFPVDTSPHFQKEYEQLLAARMGRLINALQKKAPEVSASSHLMPSAAHAAGIVDHVRDSGADLVVVGSRGQTGIKRWLLGSTAERVVRESPCSVLVSKPRGKSA